MESSYLNIDKTASLWLFFFLYKCIKLPFSSSTNAPVSLSEYSHKLSFIISPISIYQNSQTFYQNELVSDAVIKNILVIGEATRNIPEEISSRNHHIEWRKVAGMRDMMLHGYFSINYRIVWDVVKNKIPMLKE